MTNKGKKPTIIDRNILEWLKAGHSIEHTFALRHFKTTALRDSIYRLTQDNEPIIAEWVTYKTVEGKTKKYKMYYITKPLILPAGHRTQKQVEKAMGEKGSIPEISRQIQKVASSVQLPLL